MLKMRGPNGNDLDPVRPEGDDLPFENFDIAHRGPHMVAWINSK
jgi:hypothetical protein